jgi:hypothetical protein
MHGKIPRSQKRSRLSGLDLLAPEQRREKALKLIAPAPEKTTECKAEVDRAVKVVQKTKTRHKNSPIRKEDLNKAIKKLRAIENNDFLAQWSGQLVGLAKTERRVLERFIAWCEKASRLNIAYLQAALCSEWLVTVFGPRPAALTAHGPWHKLAAILIGYKRTDLFDFDYLRRIRRWRDRGEIRARGVVTPAGDIAYEDFVEITKYEIALLRDLKQDFNLA